MFLVAYRRYLERESRHPENSYRSPTKDSKEVVESRKKAGLGLSMEGKSLL